MLRVPITFKAGNGPGLGIRPFWKWAIAHFRSLALFERANERLLFSSLFLKERMNDGFFVALFKRANKSDRSFALLQRAMKRAIAHLLLFKKRMSERSLDCSFEKSGNERWAIVRMKDCPTLLAGLGICSLTLWGPCVKKLTLLVYQVIPPPSRFFCPIANRNVSSGHVTVTSNRIWDPSSSAVRSRPSRKAESG